MIDGKVTIVYDIKESDAKYIPNSEELKLTQEYYDLATKGKIENEGKLKDLIKQYPHLPQFRNYLSSLYKLNGRADDALEIIKETYALFPDYFFVKFSMADYYLSKKDIEGVSRILGSSMSLKALYPDRNSFHISEYIKFYYLTVIYFCLYGDLQEAEIRLDIIKRLEPKSQETKLASEYVYAAKIKKNLNMIQEHVDKHTKSKPQEEFVQYKPDEVQTGRNAPCPCGSGKKFKKCCLK